MNYKTVYLLVALSLGSCTKDVQEPKEEILPKQFNANEFPVKVGSNWRYKVYDAYARYTDTIVLSVISSSVIGSQIKYLCELEQKGETVDTGYYAFSNNRVEYNSTNPAYSYFGSFILNFPFKEGDNWSGFYLNDTLNVDGTTDSLKILGKLYKPVYTLKRIVRLPQYFVNQSIFVSPNVGVIYQSLDIFDGAGLQKQTFQLIEFNQ